MTASSATVDLGTFDVGVTSTPGSVNITNNGNAATTVTVTPSGVGISASGCGGSLAIGGSCKITVTALASAPGQVNGTIAVVAANGNSLNISVIGNAVPKGDFSLAPNSIPLGDIAAGASIPVSITVTANAAIADLQTGITGTDLTIDSAGSNCTATLAAGATCKIAAVFKAANAGPAVGDSLTVTSRGVTKSVPVSANVLAPAKLAATPTTVPLSATPGTVSAGVAVNVGNAGGMSTGALGVALGGANAADFVITDDKCSIVTLAGGTFCAVTVAYKPAATVTAAETATLTVTDKAAGGSSVVVTLTGSPNINGLTVAGGPDLGSVAPGASGAEVVYTVTNTSTTPTGALNVKSGNALVTVSSDTCTPKATLNKGDTCTVGLKLTPPVGTPAQAVTGQLTVTIAAGPASAPFSGAVITPASLSASPTSVTFGTIPVTQSSAPQTVTVTNKGASSTGALQVLQSGAGASQVALTANTCTGTLAGAKTCTFVVTYSPTAAGNLDASIAVSDGVTSVTIPLVGTAIVGTFVEAIDTANQNAPLSTLDLTAAPLPIGYASTVQTITVKNTDLTKDAGTIAIAATGTEFVVSASTCPAAGGATTLAPSATCTFKVTFTPSDVGTRTSSITISSTKGNVWTIAASGKGLPLLQLIALGVDATATPPTTGLDFGAQPNGTPGVALGYRIVVRGSTTATATTIAPNVALAAGTTPDFRYVSAAGCSGSNCTTVAANPCNLTGGATLALPAANASGAWSITTKTATNPASTATDDGQATNGYWTCDFAVQFYPQTGKSATPKTATLNATASTSTAGLTVSGIASGPLVFDGQSTVDFGNVAVGAAPTTQTFTVDNKGVSGVAQGKLSVAITGTNAGDFSVTADACSGQTIAAGATCDVTVAFAPGAVGAKTATLTVTAAASGETATVTMTGNAPTAAAGGIAVAPTGTVDAPVAFDSVAQADVGAWKSFTISNPAGAPVSGLLTYSIASGPFELYTLATAGVTAYPAGSCGDTATKQLNAGESCTIQVRFKPVNSAAPGAKTGELDVTDASGVSLQIALKATALSQLTLSGAAITLDTNSNQVVDFGNVGSGKSATKTITITNNAVAGSANATLAVATLPAQFAYAQTTGNCIAGSTLAPKASCQMSLVYTGNNNVTGNADGDTITIGVSGAANTNVPLILTGMAVTPATLVFYGFGDYASTGPTDTNIDLGTVPLGTSTGIIALWFKNTGKVDASGISATLSGSSAFAIPAENQGTCAGLAGVLAAGQVCSVNVRATPTGTVGDPIGSLQFVGTAIPGPTVVLAAHSVNPASSIYATQFGQTNSFYTFGTTGATAATAYFTLQNNTQNPLNLGTAADTFTGGNGIQIGLSGNTADFSLSKVNGANGTKCGATLGVGASCTFALSFLPTWDGEDRLYRWTAVTVASSNVIGAIGRVQMPAALKLTAASAGQVKVNAATSTVDFGQIMSGQVPSVTFTIQNVGEAASGTPVHLTLTNSGSTNYAVLGTSTCGTAALAPQTSCTVVVNTQLVSATGQKTGISIAATDGTVTSSDTFSLQAEVVNPASLTVSPSATAFGSSPAGTVSSTQVTITVANGDPANDSHNNRQDTGALSVVLSDTTDFSVDPASTCLNTAGTAFQGLPLSAGANTGDESCTVIVNFKPASAGAKSTTVTVTATPGGSPAAITLTGTGNSTLAITPTTFSSPQTYTITHSGDGTTGRLKETLSGTNAALYTIVTDGCFGKKLTGDGDTCTVEVAFLGTASATAQTATLTVTDGTANNTGTVNMSVSQ